MHTGNEVSLEKVIWNRSAEPSQSCNESPVWEDSLYCSGGFNVLFFSSKHFDPSYFIKISHYLTVKSLEFQQICLLTSWFSTTILLLISFTTSSKFSFFSLLFISSLFFRAPQLSCYSQMTFPLSWYVLVGMSNRNWKYSQSLMVFTLPVACVLWLCWRAVPVTWQLTWRKKSYYVHFIKQIVLDWVEKTVQCLHLWLCYKLKSLGCGFGEGQR